MQWASQWAVLVGGKVWNTADRRAGTKRRSDFWHPLFARQTAHKLQMSRTQKAHCGNAQEFLCKKGKKQTKAEKHTEIVSEAEHTNTAAGQKNEKYLPLATTEKRREKTIADDLKIY